MDVFEGLDPLSEECFVDIPDFPEETPRPLGASRRQTLHFTTASVEETEPCNAFDVDTFFEQDRSSFPSKDIALEDTFFEGRAATCDTSVSFVPTFSSDQNFLLRSSNRRLSDESSQSCHSMVRPFRSGYCRTESDLFPDFDQRGESMLFVPSTVSSADGTQKFEAEFQKLAKNVSERQPQHDAKGIARTLKKLKVKLGTEAGFAELESMGVFKAEWGHRLRKDTKGLKMSTVSSSSLTENEKSGNHPETPKSTVSDVPIAKSRRKAVRKGDIEVEGNKDGSQESVLTSCSPNFPLRKASRLLKLPPVSSMQKGFKRKSKTNAPDEETGTKKGGVSTKKKALVETQESAVKPKKGWALKKANKRPVGSILRLMWFLC
jgi:superfamily II DNA helicase RecQ